MEKFIEILVIIIGILVVTFFTIVIIAVIKIASEQENWDGKTGRKDGEIHLRWDDIDSFGVGREDRHIICDTEEPSAEKLVDRKGADGAG